MFDTYRKIWGILTNSEKKKAGIVLVLVLFVAFFEVAGVASVLPFVSVLTDPDVMLNNEWLALVFERSGLESVNQFSALLGLVLLVVFVFSTGMKALSQWAQIKFTKIRVHSIGLRLMKGYLNQPYEWYLNRHTAKMTTTILSEVNQIISKSLFPAIQIIAHGSVVLALFIFLLIINWAVALSAVVILAAAYGSLYLLVRGPLFRFGQLRYEANMDRFRVTQETFGGIKDIKIRGLESAMWERFSGPSYRTANEEVKASALQQIPGMIMQVVVLGGAVLLLLIMNRSYGSMSDALPSFSAFAFAGYRLMPSLQTLYRQFTMMRANVTALEGLIEQLNEISHSSKQGIKHNQQSKYLADQGEFVKPIVGDVSLQKIKYFYPGSDEAALDGLAIHIPENARVGLVGASGSGKTTTVDIILGLLRPSSGEIHVGDCLITDDNVRAWQSTIGYVPQHIFLADETVAGNIAYGVKPEKIDMKAVEEAARVANLHEFILNELPDGYATTVGERGMRLSGGQRQRIGIARALYHNPSVLILDEATSALDNITERAVMEAVDKLAGKKTIIMIAHRLSTVEKCDKIFVMAKGKTIASGSYKELIKESENFRALAGADDG